MLFANDANKDRAKAVVGNVHRLGITNTVVCSHDGRKFPKVACNTHLISNLKYARCNRHYVKYT